CHWTSAGAEPESPVSRIGQRAHPTTIGGARPAEKREVGLTAQLLAIGLVDAVDAAPRGRRPAGGPPSSIGPWTRSRHGRGRWAGVVRWRGHRLATRQSRRHEFA